MGGGRLMRSPWDGQCWEMLHLYLGGLWSSAVVVQHSRVTLTPSISQCCPLRYFWQATASLLNVKWPRSNQWERALLGKSYITIPVTSRLSRIVLIIVVLLVSHWQNVNVLCCFSFVHTHDLRQIFIGRRLSRLIRDLQIWRRVRYWIRIRLFKSSSRGLDDRLSHQFCDLFLGSPYLLVNNRKERDFYLGM